MKRILVILFSISALAFLPYSAHAIGDGKGSAAAEFLQIDPGAGSAGFGSAYVARDGDPLSIHFNPAGLGQLKKTEGMISRISMIEGINYNFASVVHSLENENLGGVGFGIKTLDFGSQDRTEIDGQNPVTGLGSFSARDLALYFSYGDKLTPNLSYGGTLKYVKQDLAEFDANTFSADLGLLYKTALPGLNLGVSARNLFGRMEFNEKSDPLPRTLNAATYWSIPIFRGRDELNLGLDLEYATDAEFSVSTGIEYKLFDMVAIRTGYNTRQDAGSGLTFGAGFNYEKFQFDYGFRSMGDLGNQHSFTVSYRFWGQGR